MRFFGGLVWLVVVLLVVAVAASDIEAGGGRGGGSVSGGGRSGGGHGGSHHGKAHSHHGGRIVVGVGPWWGPGWWGGWAGWYYPPVYYPYNPYYAPPAITTEPPVYMQRELEIQAPQAYWHYCLSAAAYYPVVQSCPEPWLKVPPRDH